MPKELTVEYVQEWIAQYPRLRLSEGAGEVYYVWPSRTEAPLGPYRMSYGPEHTRTAWVFDIGAEAMTVLLGWFNEDVDHDALESGVLADKLEEIRDFVLGRFAYPAAAAEMYDSFVECLRLRFTCGNLPPAEREQLALEAWEAREARLGRVPPPSEQPSQCSPRGRRASGSRGRTGSPAGPASA